MDDITQLCPSIGAAAAAIKQGCEKFAFRTSAQFNHGRTKTAVMPLFGSPEPLQEEVGCAIVHSYKLLGVLIDAGLTFEPQLDRMLALGRAGFAEMFHLAETAGFSIPVEAQQVIIRVEPLVLYAAELLVCVPRAEKALNDLQSEWAVQILGARAWNRLRAPLAVCQCGWRHRLGTKMIEAAIIARARLFLLPAEHPAAALRRLVDATQLGTWFRDVRREMAKHSVPELFETDVCNLSTITEAQGSSEIRKLLIRRYKWEVVKPRLQAYDSAAFVAAAQKYLPGLFCTFESLQPDMDAFPMSLVYAESHSRSWVWYRIWAGVRLTGCWPSYIYEQRACPQALDCCPLCLAEDVTVGHAFCDCRHTLRFYEQMASALGSDLALPRTREVLPMLFDNKAQGDSRVAHIMYVGQCIEQTSSLIFHQMSEDTPFEVSESAIDDSILQCEAQARNGVR